LPSSSSSFLPSSRNAESTPLRLRVRGPRRGRGRARR
jgi:hypothetical protein